MNFESTSEEKEYSKDSRIKRDDIQALMKWVRHDSRLPDITEFMLIQCYQVSNYDYNKCQELVNILYNYKNQAPELFTGQDYDDSKYQLKFFDVHYMFALPNISSQGYRIIFVGLRNSDSQHFNSDYYISMSLKVFFAIIIEQGSCPGYVIISDSDGYSFGHIRKINFTLMKHLLRFVAEALPINMKAIHIIRAHRITNYALALIRPFMSKEINECIKIYSDIDKFYEVIPKEYIPKDLGGTLPFTRDECNEIQRQKTVFFSNEVDRELQRRRRIVIQDEN